MLPSWEVIHHLSDGMHLPLAQNGDQRGNIRLDEAEHCLPSHADKVQNHCTQHVSKMSILPVSLLCEHIWMPDGIISLAHLAE